MDISSVAASAATSPYTYSAATSSYNQNALIVDATLGTSISDNDATTIDIGGITPGLSISVDDIIKKLNEQLKSKLPDGIESLKAEDHTPEKTAGTIVDSITGMFAAYQKSNPELSPDELITRFMKAARSGVDQGYSDAYDTLDGLGAFQFNGIKSGIEETKTLIASKLDAFEAAKRKELGADEQKAIADTTAAAIKTQAGVSLVA